MPPSRSGTDLALFASLAVVFALLRRLAPGTLLPAAGTTLFAGIPALAPDVLCARPYVFQLLFTVLTLHAFTRIPDHPRSGALQLAVSAGLVSHMSSVGLAFSGAALALGAIWLLQRRRAAALLILVGTGAVALWPAADQALGLRPVPELADLVDRVVGAAAPGPAVPFWANGGPPVHGVALLLLGLTACVWIGARRGWLARPAGSLLASNRAIAGAIGLAFSGPLFVYASFMLFGVSLFWPRYHIPETALALLLLGLLVAGRRSVGARTVLGSAVFVVALAEVVMFVMLGWLQPVLSRADSIRHVVERAAPDDLVVAVSRWPASNSIHNYHEGLYGYSYMLADALLVPGFERLRSYPAPNFRFRWESGAEWRAGVRERAAGSERVWLIHATPLQAIFDSSLLSREPWSLVELEAMGYRRVDSEIPAALRGRVYQLLPLEAPRIEDGAPPPAGTHSSLEAFARARPRP